MREMVWVRRNINTGAYDRIKVEIINDDKAVVKVLAYLRGGPSIRYVHRESLITRRRIK